VLLLFGTSNKIFSFRKHQHVNNERCCPSAVTKEKIFCARNLEIHPLSTSIIIILLSSSSAVHFCFETAYHNMASRKVCAMDFCSLADAISTKEIWACSNAFLTTVDVDNPAYCPLDTVVFNKDTNRYETTEVSLLTEDDFILQALVMWNLYRMEQGWGIQKCLAQLSVWQGKTAATTERSTLKNLWKKEATSKFVGKGLNHQDNFDTFRKYYHGTRGKTYRWARRSNTMHSNVHMLAEQSTVQWALDLQQQGSTHYRELAAAVIRVQYNMVDDGGDVTTVPKLLYQAAMTSAGDGSFCSDAMTALETASDSNP
jgi:hypothetical protein